MSTQRAGKKVIDGGSMTGTAVVTSDPTNISGLAGISYQFVWTGTPNGSFSFEVSNNHDPDRASSSTWTALSTSLISGYSGINPAGSASNSYIDLLGLQAKWVRCKYTNASSTGTLNAWAHAKAAG
jgi:hypothetical protein